MKSKKTVLGFVYNLDYIYNTMNTANYTLKQIEKIEKTLEELIKKKRFVKKRQNTNAKKLFFIKI